MKVASSGASSRVSEEIKYNYHSAEEENQRSNEGMIR